MNNCSGRSFFIVGSGRSGSTLLRMILCANSNVTIPPETYFLEPLLEKLPVNDKLDAHHKEAAFMLITSHYRWPDMEIGDEYLRSKIAGLKFPLLRDIVDVIYSYYLNKDGKPIWGDKTPAYIRIIPQLVKLYPGTRIINLVRDGRDVTKSFQATGWCGPWIKDNCREWKEAVRLRARWRQENPEIEIYDIRYEDLVQDTKGSIIKLCAFIGIDFEQGMLDWASGIEGRIPDREAHIHRKLGRKPRDTDIYRWKHEMTKRELLVSESYISNELMSSGYPLYYDSWLWKSLFPFVRLANECLLPVYIFFSRLVRYMARHIVKA